VRILADTGGSQTIETDDGRIIVVPAGVLAPPGVASPPPSGMMPQSVTDFLSPPSQLPPGGLPSFTPDELLPPPAPLPATGRAASATDVVPIAPFSAPGIPARNAGVGDRPVEPTPGAAAPPAPALPGIPTAAAEAVAGMQQQQQAQQQVLDIEARDLDATAETLRTGEDARREIAEEAQAARVADLEMLQKKTEDLSKMVDEGSNKPIDPQRHWKNMSTLQKIGVAIAAAMVGYSQGASGNGGPNPIIAQLQAQMENDVRAQMADNDERARKVGLSGQQIDRYRTVASDRVSLFNARMSEEALRMAKELETQAAKTGSEKARANALGAAGEWRTKAADYLTNAAQAQWGRDLASRKQTEEERHARKSEALQGWGIAEQKRQFDGDLKYRYDKLLLDAAQEEQKGNAAGAAAMRKQAEEARTLEIPNTVGADGQPVKARTEKEAIPLRETQAGVESGAKAIDEIINVLETGGPPSNILQSPEWQRIRSNEGALIAAVNQAMLGGVVREGDITFIRQTFAGGDLSGIEAMLREGALGTTAADGLKKTRQILERGFSDKLRSQDPKAQPYKVAPLTGRAAAPETPAGAAFRGVTDSKTPAEISRGDQRSAAGEALLGPESPGGLVSRAASEVLFGSSRGTDEPQRKAEQASGFNIPSVSADQEKQLTILTSRAAGGDAAAAETIVSLAASGRPGLGRGALEAAADSGDASLLERVMAVAPPAEVEAFTKAESIRGLANQAGRLGR
jgi:hypothetical protein